MRSKRNQLNSEILIEFFSLNKEIYYIYYIAKNEKKNEDIATPVNRRRTDNTMAKRKRTKGQTTIYKTYKY
jgi:hypothetical protein